MIWQFRKNSARPDAPTASQEPPDNPAPATATSAEDSTSSQSSASARPGLDGDRPKIFISYRRSNAFVTDHIHHQLVSKFVPSSIFLDTADIEPGERFPERIKGAVQQALIVLVVIGPDWISMQDPRTYRRRLELPEDWVRQEVELALAGSGVVIPILVEGATMPTVEQLPPSLVGLVERNAVTLSEQHFRIDAEKLINEIGAQLGAERMSRLLKESGNPYPPEGPYRPSELEQSQLQEMLKSLPQWRLVVSELDDDPRFSTGYKRIEIVRDFRFESFIDAIEFMRQAAAMIDSFGHHPRWSNVFKTVTVGYSTFEAGHRPTDRDHKSAEMLDRLYRRFIKERGSGTQ
jgi:pterin-4a-carbinolamine dehydratase